MRQRCWMSTFSAPCWGYQHREDKGICCQEEHREESDSRCVHKKPWKPWGKCITQLKCECWRVRESNWWEGRIPPTSQQHKSAKTHYHITYFKYLKCTHYYLIFTFLGYFFQSIYYPSISAPPRKNNIQITWNQRAITGIGTSPVLTWYIAGNNYIYILSKGMNTWKYEYSSLFFLTTWPRNPAHLIFCWLFPCWSLLHHSHYPPLELL